MARRRLKTSEDVRRFLAHVLNEMHAGDLDHQVGGRLAYVSNVLLGAIRNDEMEARILRLEKKVEGKDHD